MTDLRPDLADDEIDLRELFAVLWRGKWLIFSLCCVALLLASVYLHRAERKYTVTMILKPVIGGSAGPNLARLGGLASLAGVSLPQSGSGDFATFRALLPSEEVAERVIAATELLPAIFKNEWDAQDAQFRRAPRGLLGRSLSGLKFRFKRAMKTRLYPHPIRKDCRFLWIMRLRCLWIMKRDF